MERLRVCIALILLAVFIPTSAFADFHLIPRWERLDTPNGEMACYDFEQAKKLRLLDEACNLCTTHLDELKEQLQDTNEKVVTQSDTIVDLTRIIDTQERHIFKQNDRISNLKKERDSARARDALGGALPWIIGISAGLFAGGTALGIYLGVQASN